MQEAAKRAAVFLDRDGVLNVDHGYVGDVGHLEWVPGARRAVARLKADGLLVIVVSNQSGVARGLYDLAAVDALHEAMQTQLAEEGGRVDAFYVCPFLPDAAVAEFQHPDHPDRKPNPGMILRAIAEWNIDPARALMIGDKPSDMEAGRRAGVRAALFEGGDLSLFLASIDVPA